MPGLRIKDNQKSDIEDKQYMLVQFIGRKKFEYSESDDEQGHQDKKVGAAEG
jgi:hypothetical protein